MSLIKCPECMKDISESAEVCVHCGYPLKSFTQEQNAEKYKQEISTACPKARDKGKIIFLTVILLFAVIGIVVVFDAYKQAEIERYRVEFSSEDEMRDMLRSGQWYLTSFGGGYSIGGYMSFEHSFINYYEENTSKTPSRLQYKLDYKNSSILTTDGAFYYDLIYYKNDYYLRQNPNVEADRWILFRLSEQDRGRFA